MRDQSDSEVRWKAYLAKLRRECLWRRLVVGTLTILLALVTVFCVYKGKLGWGILAALATGIYVAIFRYWCDVAKQLKADDN